MQKIATLTGHTYRVLYLAVSVDSHYQAYNHCAAGYFLIHPLSLLCSQLSPDGSTIVTGAGDETLRFWQVFPGPQKENKAGGLLFPAGMPGSVIR